jgi:hypothetical protein
MGDAPPPVPLGLAPSFGFGDRLGLATPGHIAALRGAGTGIAPIFAQQSIREMTRTGRAPEQVLADAQRGMREAAFNDPYGADADHLKTVADVDRTAAAGFCFFTIDPSDHVNKPAAESVQWLDPYRSQRVTLSTGTVIEVDEATLLRAAKKYAAAVNHAVAMSRHIDQTMRRLGRDYEIELSVDETPEPTTLAEHFIIADHCLKEGMKLVSLAPRFVGDFEKGVDYKGDLQAFERSLADHAAIAKMLGPYKLSLHSGSDKLSIYTTFARLTAGVFHVKTAGTSYLEALRVAAIHDAPLFRRIIDFARNRYQQDRATYHVSAELENTPPPSIIDNPVELEQVYLERWETVPAGRGFTAPGRQILHTTFGSVLTNESMKAELFQVLREHRDTYRDVLEEHFSRHLAALAAGM